MIQFDAIGTHGFRNSSTSKFFARGGFRIGRQEERVVSFSLLNESPQTAVPPQRRPIRASSRINILGSGR
jgi:hypothetical protein